MKRTLLFLTALLGTLRPVAHAGDALNVGDRREWFVHRFLVAELKGTSLSEPRENTARASSGNGSESKFRSLPGKHAPQSSRPV